MMIERTGFLGRIYTIMEWITMLAYINILWIFLTILGLILFGLAPATTAMYTVTRKWLQGNTDIKIFKTFFHTYKLKFIKSNILVWPIVVMGYILYIDFQYLSYVQGPFYYVMFFIFINASLIFIVLVLYLIPTIVHFNLNFLQNYKIALLIGVSSPFITITMIVSILIILLVLERIPGLLPFFSASLLSLIIMWYTDRAFLKVKK